MAQQTFLNQVIALLFGQSLSADCFATLDPKAFSAYEHKSDWIMLKIGFAGATGMLGLPVCRRLLADGATVKVMVRDPRRLSVKHADLEIVQGDVMSPSDMRRAFTGCDVVYLSLSPSRVENPSKGNPEVTAVRTAVTMAKAGETGRVGYLSSLMQEYTTYDWWVLNDKRSVVRELRESGVPYSHFLPSTFMENIPNRYVRGNSIALIGQPVARWWWIAARDYAAVVSASLRQPHERQEDVIVQGTQPLSNREAAERFAHHLPERKLKVVQAPKAVLRLVSVFQPELRYAIRITEAGEELHENFLAQRSWERYGKPEISIERFAAEHLWH